MHVLYSVYTKMFACFGILRTNRTINENGPSWAFLHVHTTSHCEEWSIIIPWIDNNFIDSILADSNDGRGLDRNNADGTFLSDIYANYYLWGRVVRGSQDDFGFEIFVTVFNLCTLFIEHYGKFKVLLFIEIQRKNEIVMETITEKELSSIE